MLVNESGTKTPGKVQRSNRLVHFFLISRFPGRKGIGVSADRRKPSAERFIQSGCRRRIDQLVLRPCGFTNFSDNRCECFNCFESNGGSIRLSALFCLPFSILHGIDRCLDTFVFKAPWEENSMRSKTGLFLGCVLVAAQLAIAPALSASGGGSSSGGSSGGGGMGGGGSGSTGGSAGSAGGSSSPAPRSAS